MTDPVALQTSVESQLVMAIHYLRMARSKQGHEPVHLSYQMRRDLETELEHTERLLDAAEENYRKAYGDAA